MKNGAKIAIVALLAVAVAATFALRGGKRAEYVARARGSPPAVPAPRAGRAAGRRRTRRAAAPEPRSRRSQSPASSSSARCAARPAWRWRRSSTRCARARAQSSRWISSTSSSNPEAADRYKISLIPTQILFDAAGKEIFRHTGYFSHDDILAKFRELGVKL